VKTALHRLDKEYTAALRQYLKHPGEAMLHRSYQLGRKALEGGLGVLEIAALHEKILAKALSGAQAPEESRRIVKAAASFFLESLAPFEMTHRAAMDANSALRHLNEKLEQEAKRIAHSLHDEAGQFLACTQLALDEVHGDLPPAFHGRLQHVRAILDQLAGHLRQISHELRPKILDDYGLIPALEFLAAGISQRSKLQISVKGSEKYRLPAPVETALYRIVQEALTNASKHAHATRVTVRVERRTRAILCSIRDDGVGLDRSALANRNKQSGLGLLGIRHRLEPLGGMLKIESEGGHGTHVRISIPLEK
jgi:signal transduction histidine kinase